MRQPGRSGSARRRYRPGGVRQAAAARLCQLRAALFPRAQPAHPIRDELACRTRRGETRGRARRRHPAADRQPAAAPPEVAVGLGRLSGLVSRARALGADPLRQLCPGPRRQAVAGLPAHPRQRVVPADLPDPALAAAPGGARVRHDGPGLPPRHLGRRRLNRARRRPPRHRRSLEARGGVVAGPAPGGQRVVRPHPLQPPQRQADGRHHPDHAPAARGRSRRPGAGPGTVGGRAYPGDRR